MFTLIIPSYNEEGYIGGCLATIAAQQGLPAGHGIQVIVAANGCRDRTVAIAESWAPALAAAGFDPLVLDLPAPGKTAALNAAEARATWPARAFLDADVTLDPDLVAELARALDRPDPVYVSGSVRVPRPRSWVSRAYARAWTSLPFVAEGVPGIGLYAFNGAGRKRWGDFPPIIADDRFVRLQFAPHERLRLRAAYDWPLPEGLGNLVKVRRRWCEGNQELVGLFPDLLVNDSERNHSWNNALRLARRPLDAALFTVIYVLSHGIARLTGPSRQWKRGRD